MLLFLDGLNEVRATCRLHVRLVTMEMLEKSVTIRINNMTSDAFLSPLFTFFIDALAHIINVSKANIFVINVRNDTDVMAQILNVTVSIREKRIQVDRQKIDVFYSAEFLKEQIYLQRTLLANLSTLQVAIVITVFITVFITIFIIFIMQLSHITSILQAIKRGCIC